MDFGFAQKRGIFWHVVKNKCRNFHVFLRQIFWSVNRLIFSARIIFRLPYFFSDENYMKMGQKVKNKQKIDWIFCEKTGN